MADIKLLGNGDLSWNQSQSDNYFQVEKFQAVASGTLKSIRLYFSGAGSGNAKVAIYSDSSGSPNALLASASGACAAGWNTINISDVTIVSGTYYWLAHVVLCDSYLQAVGSGGVSKYKSVTYSTFTFPDPAGTGFTNDTWSYAHAGWGAESGGSIVPILAQDRRRRVA